MNRYRAHPVPVALLLAMAVIAIVFTPVDAAPFGARSSTKHVALQTAEPIPAPFAETIEYSEATIGVVADGCNVYEPDVRYRVRGHRPACCNRSTPVEVTLYAKDPRACDCYAKIPVCLPCCCVGEATICNRAGILGRCWVDYEWECGFKISVLFRARGDVVVNYVY